MERYTTTYDGEQPGDVREIELLDKYDPDATRVAAIVRLAGHDLTYRVRAITGSNGPEIAELTIICSRALTADDLRRIPVHRLAVAVFRAVSTFGTGEWARPEGTRGKQRLTDEHFRNVAELARAAFMSGVPVRDAVAAELGASPFSVDKWLRACRERGYLKPGELRRRKRP